MSTTEKPKALSQFAILERLSKGETLPPHEVAYLTALLLERETTRKQTRPYFSEERHDVFPGSGTTDGTTGNLMIQLYGVEQGWEAHVTDVLVDIPGSATITPAAPYANAASWMYLAIVPKGQKSEIAAANAGSSMIRDGMVAFAPVSAAGPFIPGQWTFNDSNAPILRDQEILCLALVGGSQAAIQSQQVQTTTRINRFKRAVS